MRSFSGFRDSDTDHSLLQHTSHAGPNPPFQNGVSVVLCDTNKAVVARVMNDLGILP